MKVELSFLSRNSILFSKLPVLLALFFFFLQIAIVITDGEQTTNKGPYTPLSIASRGLKDKNVRVYALGIGKRINRDQLNEIASSNVNIFTATSFSELAPLAQIIVQYSSNPGRPWQMYTIHPAKWLSTKKKKTARTHLQMKDYEIAFK